MAARLVSTRTKCGPGAARISGIRSSSASERIRVIVQP